MKALSDMMDTLVRLDTLVGLDQEALLFAGRSILIAAYLLLNLCILWHYLPTRVPAEIQLDLYETAVLSHNEAIAAAITTAVVRLVQRGVLGTIHEPRQLQIEGPLPPGSHLLEEAVYRAATVDGTLERVLLACRPAAQVAYLRVRALGLIYAIQWRIALYVLFLLIWIPLMITVFRLADWDPPARAPLPVMGASVVGLLGSPAGPGALLAASTLFPEPTSNNERHRTERRMSFSVIGAFMIVFCLNALVLIASPCTRRGESLLRRLQRQHGPGTDSDPAWRVALYGIDALANSQYAYLKLFFNPPPSPPDHSNPC